MSRRQPRSTRTVTLFPGTTLFRSVLISYGATEFGGGVAGWNIKDHAAHWATKRGSVGRAHAGYQLRVVDPESGEPLGPDTPGVLAVVASQLGEQWDRPQDLARIDEAGFLWIQGRGAQALTR